MSPQRRNALVTGGASGIGRSICLRLAHDGAGVAIFDVDYSGAQQVAQECEAFGRKAFACQGDVTSRTEVDAAIVQAHRELGAVHIVVNNAGIADYVPLVRMDEEQWDRMIAVHLKGTFNCTKAVVKDMIDARWGRIVNITSLIGLPGIVGLTHYYAAKAGIIGFTKAVAQELGPKGITVNAIAPGLVETPILGKAIPREKQRQEFTSALIDRTPVRRAGTPADIAAACSYIVSEEASFLTGQILSPNGGIYT